MIAGEGRTVDPSVTFTINGLKQGWNLIGSLTDRLAIPVVEGDCEIEALFCYDKDLGYMPCGEPGPDQTGEVVGTRGVPLFGPWTVDVPFS